MVPQGQSGLLGAVVWVKYGDRETFALVTDTGPKFGEGSVALHQMLQYGAVQEYQPVGPIAKRQRCGASEQQIKAPFQSKPDARNDLCSKGHVAKSDTDIRAYAGIESNVISIILPGVKPDMKGTVVQMDLSKVSLAELARDAGFTESKLRQMAVCGL